MAYMNQDRKATIASNVKPILAKYGMKGSLSVRNHSAIVLTLSSGPVDFIGDMVLHRQNGYGFYTPNKDKMRVRYEVDINPYWYHEHYTGQSLALIGELIQAIKSAGWYDRSDAQIDYFDTAYYFDIRVGKWNKPYVLTK